MRISTKAGRRAALVSHFACFGTLVQYAFCVSVSFLLILGHWCRLVSALWSMVSGFDKTRIYYYAIYNIKQGVGGIV